VNTVGYRRFGFLQKILPSLPDAKIQASFVGRAGDRALLQAFDAYRLFKSLAKKHGRPLDGQSRVLDFGCGWGRILRFFMRDVAPGHLLGVDVMPRAIELCRSTNPWAEFRPVPAFPPTDLPADHFDLVYLFSVFSHLSEEAHDRWLTEFCRVMKPGGILIATTRPREYIRLCEQARQRAARSGHPGMERAFVGTEEWLARYDRGEYCHSAVGGGKSLDASFYGETAIPEAYVRQRWSERFEFCEFLSDRRRCSQDVIVARKPS
jgi:SAM-dependent methyltransferase